MTDCNFCNGEWMESNGVGEGDIMPMGINFAYLIGKWPNGHGVRLDRNNGKAYLMFDNSCGEYAEGAIDIKYCPFCGKEIET